MASRAPTRAELQAELAGISAELADVRSRFDSTLALRPDSAAELLSRAQVSYLEEDYPLAVARLLDLTARPDFQRGPGYGEALTWLGESLWAMGFHRAAAAELRRALEQPAVPSVHRHTMLRYLSLAAAEEPLEQLRGHWQRYQRSRPEGPLAPEDREVRYLYARALFRGGALSEARALFAAIAQGDPHALQALCFLGVVEVAQDDVKAARAAFEVALAAWKRAGRPPRRAARGKEEVPPEPDYWDVEPREGPSGRVTLAAEELEPTSPETALDEALQLRARLGQAIHLALARLDATQGELGPAVAHYRRVPPGSPDFPAAMQELVWALYRRGEYQRAARILDHLLAGRGDDRTGAELAIWKAHLLALAADYEGSRENYLALETSLARRRDELEADLARDPRIFPEPVLAWTVPGTANRARRLEAELVTQEEELAEAREVLAALQAAFRSPDLLPTVRAGHAAHARLGKRLALLGTRLDAADGTQAPPSVPPGPASAAAPAPASPEPAPVPASDQPVPPGPASATASGLPVPPGPASAPASGLPVPAVTVAAPALPPATPADVAELRQGAARLAERLARFAVSLEQAEKTWRVRIDEVTRAEAPTLGQLEAALADETAAARRLAMAMAVGARARLEEYSADAHFRQIDLAWWRVNEMRRRIEAARREQKATLAPMLEEVEDFRRERRRDPIPGLTEEDFQPPWTR